MENKCPACGCKETNTFSPYLGTYIKSQPHNPSCHNLKEELDKTAKILWSMKYVFIGKFNE